MGILNSKKQSTMMLQSTAHVDLEHAIGNRVFGQPEAIKKIVPYLKAYNVGMNTPGKPVGVIMCLGPTGTGKTHTPHALADVLHGNDQKVVKINLNEYLEDNSVARLIGAPPGYVGNNIPPAITNKRLKEATSARSKLSIVIFDEYEKAAPAVSKVLLSVLDTGKLTAGDNSEVDFTNSIIFLTSNIGQDDLALRSHFGFASKNKLTKEKQEVKALDAIKKKFAPEFIARLDETLVYNQLSRETINIITKIQIDKCSSMLAKQKITLVLSKKTEEFLQNISSKDTQFGVRELNRTLDKKILRPLASMVYDKELMAGNSVQIVMNGEEEIKFRITKTALPKFKVSLKEHHENQT